MSKEAIMEKAKQSIVEADEDIAMEALAEAEAEGVDLVELLSNGYSAGMKELGDLFGMGEIFLPELIFATEVMKAVSAEIEGKMDMSEVKSAGTLVIGTVEGDVHDIGKGIVASLVKTNGVEVIDLGREVPAQNFVDAAIEHNAEFVGSSALLTTTMTVQKDIEDALKEAGIRDKVKTMVCLLYTSQSLPHIDFVSSSIVCEEAPGELGSQYLYYTEMQNSTKPIIGGSTDAEGVPRTFKLLKAVLGSEEAVRTKPYTIFDICVTSPLKWSHIGARNIIDCVRMDIPINLISAQIAGATGPITLAGCILNHTVEILAGLVLAQVVKPGHPVSVSYTHLDVYKRQVYPRSSASFTRYSSFLSLFPPVPKFVRSSRLRYRLIPSSFEIVSSLVIGVGVLRKCIFSWPNVMVKPPR